MKPAAPDDYRELARRRLPPFLFEYIDGGSYAEISLKQNRSYLENIALRQRVMQDVSDIDLSTTLFGTRYAMPIGLAPVGIAGMNARRGEVQAVRAANRRNVPFCLSTVSACPLSEVAAGASEPFWFQLYMIRDRAFMLDLLQQAKAAGCSALVFTVDMPVPGTRYRDYRSGLAGSAGMLGSLRRFGQALMHPHWAWNVGVLGRPHNLGNVAPVLGPRSGLEDFFAWMRNNFDPSINWSDLDSIRDIWDGPIIVKGIMDAEDARIAGEHGADGVIVSNHGGRQLDGVPATAEALPAIAEAVRDKMTVLVDGGIRSGLDVARMLALGANAVLLGRPWVYALAARGQAGVEHVLELFEAEMRVAMALTATTRVGDLDKSKLVGGTGGSGKAQNNQP